MLLKLIHAATPNTTKLSCPCRVRFGGVNWIPDNSRLLPTENLKSEHVQSNRPLRSRHDTDRTVLSCLAAGVNWALVKLAGVARNAVDVYVADAVHVGDDRRLLSTDLH